MHSHHWANIVISVGTGVGAFVAAVGAGYGTLYGRRASVSLSGEAHVIPEAAAVPPGSFLVVARVRVRAVGLLKVKFHEETGAEVRLAEAYVNGDGVVQVEPEDPERSWSEQQAFGQEYVDPGEELSTSVTFAPLRPDDSVVGWMAFVYIHAPTRLKKFRTAFWADRVFIPRLPTDILS